MKKIYALILSSFISLSGYGTHLMGGEMTVEHLGGTDYVIHLTAYRDTLGVPFQSNADFIVYDNLGGIVLMSTVYQSAGSGALMTGYPYGVETYFFHDTITVPGPGEYTVTWFNCCRNGAIQNLTDPLSENMYLSTTFTNVASGNNSTPVFLAPPVTYLPINQPWQYNSLPFDVDGDSLVWTIDTPLTNLGQFAIGWVAPSAGSAPDAFTLDATTGQIDWTPNLIGNFVASIRVEEYNNGVKIGEIRRDYQMIVIPDTCKSPQISNFEIFPVDANDHAYMNLYADEPTNIIMLAEDPEGNPVEFLAFGEPFLHPTNPAEFLTEGFNNNSVHGTFRWIPEISQVRAKPYIVVFRTRDEIFTFDETVLFYVKLRGADPEVIMDNIYPSPANSMIFVPVKLNKASQVSLSIYATNGSKLADHNFGMVQKGNHLKEVRLNLSSGTYIVTLNIDGKNSITQKIVVSKY